MARALQSGLRDGGLKRGGLHAGIGNGSIFTIASLDLNFARYKNTGSLVTFNRASTGTFVGSDGLIQSAVTNLLTFSEQFNNAAWSVARCTISANTSIAPDGLTTGDTLVEDTTNNSHPVFRTISGLANGAAYTASVYIKASARNRSRVALANSAFIANTYVDFNFAAITATGNNANGSITQLSNDWYRCTVTATTIAAASGDIFIQPQDSAGNTFYLGTGVNALLIWGAQLEQASTVGEYIPTTSAINSAPRFDHNPTTGESLGLLVEEARTNLLLRSEEFDNAGWAKSSATVSANVAVSPDGNVNADLITDSSTLVEHYVDQTCSTTTNQAYTQVIYAKAGTAPSFRIMVVAVGSSSITSVVIFTQTAGVIVAGGIAGLITSATATPVNNGWYRCAVTYTLNGTVTVHQMRIYPYLAGIYAGTGLGTFFWGAQLEAGAFPTSYIKNIDTVLGVTRAADVASITGSNFSSWYNQTEGTVFAEAISVATNTSVFSISDNSTNNRIQLETGSNTRRFRITSSGSARYDNSVSYTFGTQGKTAGAYLDTSTNHATNGTLGSSSTASPLPVVDRIYIGSNAAGSLPNNGTIRRLVYFPTRLPNNTLQAISQP